MEKIDKTILVAGAGNIGGAMARGLAAAGCKVALWNRSEARLRNFKDVEGIRTTTSVADAFATQPDMVLVCTEGDAVPDVLGRMESFIGKSDPIVVSCAAVPTLADLASWLPNLTSPRLVRVLPNIAATVGRSVNLIATSGLEEHETELVDRVMAVTGSNFFVPESLFPAAMSVSSCGIAFALRYVRATTEAAVEHGLAPALASALCAATMEGAAAMLAGGAHAEELVDRVTTPGGLTIRGLNAMEAAGFSAAVMAGIGAASRH